MEIDQRVKERERERERWRKKRERESTLKASQALY
jgi:hypothetical protein